MSDVTRYGRSHSASFMRAAASALPLVPSGGSASALSRIIRSTPTSTKHFAPRAPAPGSTSRWGAKPSAWLRATPTPRPVLAEFLDTSRSEHQRGKELHLRILRRAAAGEWDVINAMLSAPELTDLTDALILSLLRGTFSMRDRLDQWESARDRVCACWRGRDDLGALMVGLADVPP